MYRIDLSADAIAAALTQSGSGVCILDSCGVGESGSNLMIAGAKPVRTVRLGDDDPGRTLAELDTLFSGKNAVVFTLSYDLGLAINRIGGKRSPSEPQVFAAEFEALAVHDYETGSSFLAGDPNACREIAAMLEMRNPHIQSQRVTQNLASHTSNFSRSEYIAAVEQIRELIRDGETYQANLTQQLSVPLPGSVTPRDVFLNLRSDHPAAFAAYLDRGDSTVVSASPEQFLKIEIDGHGSEISTSPIKGTRPRGRSRAEDELLRTTLLTSEKDRAENTMIVDLMRNDIGRVCEFGSVEVTDLCRIEEHPTLFHLVSSVRGRLRSGTTHSDIIRAVFPCGSITGAPKVRTMQILDRLETVPRGLSMGAIGCRIPGDRYGTREIFEMSVAIRTMVIRNDIASFNVGGGIVIDSVPEAEYDESMLKAKALLRALGTREEVGDGSGAVR